jgi:hypothetical protein
VIELYRQDGKPLPTPTSWKTLATGITSEGEEARRHAI